MDLVVELPAPRGQRGTCRYRAVAKLGGGSFGDILAAVNELDPHDWTALKVELRYRAGDTERKTAEPSMVRFEQLVCRELARATEVSNGRRARRCPCAVVRGLASLYDEQNVLAMELMGPNLREYAQLLDCWPLHEDLVSVLGAAAVGRLQQLHSVGFVHRDLKPENLVLCLDAHDEGAVPSLTFVDFAMSMRFSRPGGSAHIAMRDDEGVAGTHRYMAIHAQKGVTQSRRSDLESLAYVLVYLAVGQLPWQSQEKVPVEMLRKKEQTSIPELCKGLRSEAFANFLRYSQSLQFEEDPDYEFLQRTLLEGVIGPVNFEVAKVRQEFKRHLQEAYLRHEAALSAASEGPFKVLAPNDSPNGSLKHMLPIFVRYDPKSDPKHFLVEELVPYQAKMAADLDDQRCFFIEGYRKPLPGTQHVVVGSRRFFGFLRREYLVGAHEEANLDVGSAEEIYVYSLGKRDSLVRAAEVRDYDARTGKPHHEWNLRFVFWARVLLPRAAAVAAA